VLDIRTEAIASEGEVQGATAKKTSLKQYVSVSQCRLDDSEIDGHSPSGHFEKCTLEK
jgi:hypothetical protein